MHEIVVDFWAFLADVFWHWQGWLSGGGFGGAVLIVIALWEKATGKSMGRHMYLSIVLGAFLFGAFFVAWRSKYQELKALQVRLASPEFKGTIVGTATAPYGGNKREALIVAEIQIANPLGPPSAALEWQMTVELPNSVILQGEEAPLSGDDISGPVGPDRSMKLTLRYTNFLPLKTMQPIPAGGAVGGWYWSVFRGVGSQELYEKKAKVVVSFSDVITGKRHTIEKILDIPGVAIPGLPSPPE